MVVPDVAVAVVDVPVAVVFVVVVVVVQGMPHKSGHDLKTEANVQNSGLNRLQDSGSAQGSGVGAGVGDAVGGDVGAAVRGSVTSGGCTVGGAVSGGVVAGTADGTLALRPPTVCGSCVVVMVGAAAVNGPMMPPAIVSPRSYARFSSATTDG